MESDIEDERSGQDEGCSSTDDTSSTPDDCESSGCDKEKVVSKKESRFVESTNIEEKVEEITKKLTENVLK